jgi:hypothetical protein
MPKLKPTFVALAFLVSCESLITAQSIPLSENTVTLHNHYPAELARLPELLDRIGGPAVWQTYAAEIQSQHDELLPKGYRFPTEADYRADWKDFRSSVPVPFHVSADFDGNGTADDAWIVLADRGGGWALVVFMRSATGQARLVTLITDSGKTPAQRMGITPVAPGRYETACGKGYWDCKPNEPKTLNLRLPSFEFFLYESASSIFWWDDNANKFRGMWMSD